MGLMGLTEMPAARAHMETFSLLRCPTATATMEEQCCVLPPTHSPEMSPPALQKGHPTSQALQKTPSHSPKSYRRGLPASPSSTEETMPHPPALQKGPSCSPKPYKRGHPASLSLPSGAIPQLQALQLYRRGHLTSPALQKEPSRIPKSYRRGHPTAPSLKKRTILHPQALQQGPSHSPKPYRRGQPVAHGGAPMPVITTGAAVPADRGPEEPCYKSLAPCRLHQHQPWAAPGACCTSCHSLSLH